MVKKYSLEIFVLNSLLKGKTIKINISNKNILLMLYKTITILFWEHVILFVFQDENLILFRDLAED